MLLVHCLEYLCPEDGTSGSSYGGHRSSRHRDSTVDGLRATPRASFDSGVVVDRDQYGSPRRSSSVGTAMHRAHSTVTIRCDSIESDDDDMEHVSLASTSQGTYGTTMTLLVPGQLQQTSLQSPLPSSGEPSIEIFSTDPTKRPAFVSQFGPTLKPPDPFRFQFERPITPRLPRPRGPGRGEIEKRKIYSTGSSYGTIRRDDDDRDRQQRGTLRPKQQDELLPAKNVAYDKRIPILILPDDDSG